MYWSFQFQMNKKERVICKFEMDIKKSFSWRSNISNKERIFWRPGMKSGMDFKG